MKKLLIWVLFVFVWLNFVLDYSLNSNVVLAADSTTSGSSSWWWDACKDGVKLNTKVPFVSWGDGCIEKDTKTSEAFPELMWGISKLVLSIILIAAFIMIVAWWVLYASEWLSPWTAAKWKDLIKKVIIWLILLWLSWTILHIINPNFFQ